MADNNAAQQIGSILGAQFGAAQRQIGQGLSNANNAVQQLFMPSDLNKAINQSIMKNSKKFADSVAKSYVESVSQQPNGLRAIAEAASIEEQQSQQGQQTQADVGSLFSSSGLQSVGADPQMSVASPEQLASIRQGLSQASSQQKAPIQPKQTTQKSGQTTTGSNKPEEKGRNVLKQMVQGFALGGLGATAPAAVNLINAREQRAHDESLARMASFADLGKELDIDPMSPDASAKFSALLEGQQSVEEAAQILLEDIGSTRGLVIANRFTPAIFKSDKLKMYEAAIERAIQKQTRAETGANMPAEELANTKKRYMPRVGDSPEVVQARLRPLFESFSSAVNIADPNGVHRNRAQGGSGFDNTPIEAYEAEIQRRMQEGLLK